MYVIELYKYKEYVKTWEEANDYIYESEDLQDKLDCNYEIKITEDK